jgi:hypothetical protein
MGDETKPKSEVSAEDKVTIDFYCRQVNRMSDYEVAQLLVKGDAKIAQLSAELLRLYRYTGAEDIDEAMDQVREWANADVNLDATIVLYQRQEARLAKAEAGYRFMVEHAVDQKLDGYRELGMRLCAAVERAEKAEAEAAERKTDWAAACVEMGLHPTATRGQVVDTIVQREREVEDYSRALKTTEKEAMRAIGAELDARAEIRALRARRGTSGGAAR